MAKEDLRKKLRSYMGGGNILGREKPGVSVLRVPELAKIYNVSQEAVRNALRSWVNTPRPSGVVEITYDLFEYRRDENWRKVSDSFLRLHVYEAMMELPVGEIRNAQQIADTLTAQRPGNPANKTSVSSALKVLGDAEEVPTIAKLSGALYQRRAGQLTPSAMAKYRLVGAPAGESVVVDPGNPSSASLLGGVTIAPADREQAVEAITHREAMRLANLHTRRVEAEKMAARAVAAEEAELAVPSPSDVANLLQQRRVREPAAVAEPAVLATQNGQREELRERIEQAVQEDEWPGDMLRRLPVIPGAPLLAVDSKGSLYRVVPLTEAE